MGFAEVTQLVKVALDAARPRLPAQPAVHDFRIKVGIDSTGDESIWIWVILADSARDADLRYARLEKIADIIRRAIRGEFTGHTLDLIPYVSFRTKSEQQAIEAGTS